MNPILGQWRNTGRMFIEVVMRRENRQMRRRYTKGISKYGNQFQGNPREHALEEARDTLYYLNIIKQRDEATVKVLGQCLREGNLSAETQAAVRGLMKDLEGR